MSGFYYWIPEQRPSIKADDLVACGLAYCFAGEKHTPRGCDEGPDGKRGVVVCVGNNGDGKLGYYPERQTWKRMPQSDLWCGHYTDSSPTPTMLARQDSITGQWVRLDDGNLWLCPIARKWMEQDGQLVWAYNLPQRLTLDDDGQWITGGVKPKYQRLWELAVRYEQASLADEEAEQFTLADLSDLAVAALQVNYRVSAIELDMLAVFDQQSRQKIVDVLVDNYTLVQWLSKKNALARDGGIT